MQVNPNRPNLWGQRIQWRPFSRPHPNFLWHINTNMELHHWQMRIHGCVGFFHAIIHLRVNNNNRDTTVLFCFQQATSAIHSLQKSISSESRQWKGERTVRVFCLDPE